MLETTLAFVGAFQSLKTIALISLSLKTPLSPHVPPGPAVLTGRFDVGFRFDSVEGGDDEYQAACKDREEDPKSP